MKNMFGIVFLVAFFGCSVTSFASDADIRRRDFWFSCVFTFFTGSELLGKHHPSFEEMNTPHSKWKNLPIQQLGESFKSDLISKFGLTEVEAELQRIRLQELLWFRVKNFYSVLDSQGYQAQGEVTFKNVVFSNEFEVDLPSGERLVFAVKPTWHLVIEKNGSNALMVKNIVPVGELGSFISLKSEEGKN